MNRTLPNATEATLTPLPKPIAPGYPVEPPPKSQLTCTVISSWAPRQAWKRAYIKTTHNSITWPRLLYPQQFTVPPLRRAQEWSCNQRIRPVLQCLIVLSTAVTTDQEQTYSKPYAPHNIIFLEKNCRTNKKTRNQINKTFATAFFLNHMSSKKWNRKGLYPAQCKRRHSAAQTNNIMRCESLISWWAISQL